MKLHVERVSVTYNKGEPNETVGLPPVTLTLASGQPLVLNGPNGCGKTTLLKVLAGLIVPSQGSVIEVGECGNTRLNTRWLRTNSAYLRQQPTAGLFLDLTLAENLALLLPESSWFDPYWPSGVLKAAEALVTELVPFYSSHRVHYLTELSGGQQQLFAIACTGVGGRQLLLFDEPTSALDPQATERTETLLRSLCLKPGVISLIVSHDVGLAPKLGFMSKSFHMITEQAVVPLPLEIKEGFVQKSATVSLGQSRVVSLTSSFTN